MAKRSTSCVKSKLSDFPVESIDDDINLKSIEDLGVSASIASAVCREGSVNDASRI